MIEDEKQTPENSDEYVTLYNVGDAIQDFKMELARPLVPVVDAMNRGLLWVMGKLGLLK